MKTTASADSHPMGKFWPWSRAIIPIAFACAMPTAAGSWGRSSLPRVWFDSRSRPIRKTSPPPRRDNAVRMYSVASGERIWSHVIKLTSLFENYTSALAFSLDGQTLAVCATDNRIYLIKPSTGEEAAVLIGHHWYPWALAFTADSKMLYSSGWDGFIRRWDVATRKQLPLPVGNRTTGVIAASPDGRHLAYEIDSGVIRLREIESGEDGRSFALGGATKYSQLMFSPDGQRLAGGGTCGNQLHVAVWDVAGGKLLHRWDWPTGCDLSSTVESLSFTPDGNRLAAAVFRQSAAYIWDLKTGRQIRAPRASARLWTFIQS